MTETKLVLDEEVDLYERYAARAEEERQATLRSTLSEESRRAIEKERPLSREQFEGALAGMSEEDRRDFVQRLLTPYKQLQAETRQLLRQHRQAFETDPAYREQIGSEVTAALAKTGIKRGPR